MIQNHMFNLGKYSFSRGALLGLLCMVRWSTVGLSRVLPENKAAGVDAGL